MGGESWNCDRFYFLGSKSITNSDCSQEIKRYLLLGRKAMTNLDSVLKSRDITLPTNVCIVKATFFPVVMHRCESWAITKAEHQRIDAFEFWCWRRTERLLDSKEIKPVNPKGNQPWILIGRTDAKAEALILQPTDVKSWLTVKVPDAGKDWGQEEKREKKLRWLDAITDSTDVRLNKLQGIVKDREDWRAAVHGVAKSWTWLRNWTTGNVGLSWQLSGQESARQCRKHRFDPWFGKIPLEKEMAAHSSMLAWKISWTGEPSRFQELKELVSKTTNNLDNTG